jgi:DNA-binding transcriptional ArsR family regulator
MPEPIDKLKAEFFKTLGHPARIRILELLAEDEHSVGELMPKLGLESSHLSQQLAVLRRTGMVLARKQGNNVIYSIASKDMSELLLLARKVLTGLLTDQMDLLKDLQSTAQELGGTDAGSTSGQAGSQERSNQGSAGRGNNTQGNQSQVLADH